MVGRPRISNTQKKVRRRFGLLLREWRASQGIDLREAARVAGLDHTRLSRIERGERPVREEILVRLARGYQAPWEALVIARSGQIPLALSRAMFEPLDPGTRRSETFTQRVTPREKRELTIFLDYLRFAQIPEEV